MMDSKTVKQNTEATRKDAALLDSAAFANKAERALSAAAILGAGSVALVLCGQYSQAATVGIAAGFGFAGSRLFKSWQDACLGSGYSPTPESINRAKNIPETYRPSGVY